jgi:hypothetical protein
MSDDERLLQLLAAIQTGEDSDRLMTNDLLVKRLKWKPAEVAACLADAKQRMLLWGVPSGGTPKPYYEDLELTVQGRRLLAGR